MREKSTTFMTLGTTLGMFIALIISLVLLFTKGNTSFIPFIFLGLAIALRCIGYGLDRILDKHK